MGVMTGTILTVGIGGTTHKFQWQMNPDDRSNPGEFTFFVYEMTRNELKFYSHTFKVLRDGTYQSDAMNNNGHSAFEKKGIPEKILEVASGIFKKDIRSSNIVMRPGDFMINASQKAWDRLVSANAKASKREGYYILKP